MGCAVRGPARRRRIFRKSIQKELGEDIRVFFDGEGLGFHIVRAHPQETAEDEDFGQNLFCFAWAGDSGPARGITAPMASMYLTKSGLAKISASGRPGRAASKNMVLTGSSWAAM